MIKNSAKYLLYIFLYLVIPGVAIGCSGWTKGYHQGWTYGILLCLGWFLLGSFLIWLTWNKVVMSLFNNVKVMEYWHALIIVLTIGIFCAPRYAHKYHRLHNHHQYDGYHKGNKCKKDRCVFQDRDEDSRNESRVENDCPNH